MSSIGEKIRDGIDVSVKVSRDVGEMVFVPATLMMLRHLSEGTGLKEKMRTKARLMMWIGMMLPMAATVHSLATAENPVDSAVNWKNLLLLTCMIFNGVDLTFAYMLSRGINRKNFGD